MVICVFVTAKGLRMNINEEEQGRQRGKGRRGERGVRIST